MNALRLRAALLASGAGLIVTLGFPDSAGLWPLRLVAEWPAAIGRAIAELLFSGKLGPLALSRVGEIASAGPPTTRAIVAVVGLALQLATAVAFFRLALRLQPTRWILFALAGATGIAGLIPPAAASVSVAELGAASALLALALYKDEAVPRLGLQFLAGVLLTEPLAALRPVLLSLGRATGEVGILEAVTGLPAPLWALLATGAAIAVLALMSQDKTAKVRPA